MWEILVDNYQRVRAAAVDATCQFFLDRLPAGLQVIFASQEQFPFAVQRWRGKGILTELTPDDLRLTPEEGVAWLDQAISIPLTEREKLSLVLQAQGWAAGLNLLALALKKREQVHQFIATFDGHHPYLQEYFVEEILRKHPPERQLFLLQTSILKNLNEPLCDAVTGQMSSGQILQCLHRANQFVTLIDQAQPWYQYHDLFAQALQDQLRQQFPQEITHLHRCAATWYQSHEFYSEAIHHLLQAGDWPEVVPLIEQVILDELRRGSDHRLLKWLPQLPDELFLQHETLLFTYARLARPSLPRHQVEGWLKRLTARIEATTPAVRTTHEQHLLARLHEWQQPRTREYPLPPAESAMSDIDQVGIMLDATYQALCLVEWEEIAAREALLAQVVEAGKIKGLLFNVLHAGGTLVSRIVAEGRLRESEALARNLLQWVLAQTGSLPPCASILLTDLGRICYARNQLVQARQFVDDAVMIDPHPTSINIVMHHYVLLAHILRAQGNRQAALATLQAALEMEPYLSDLYTTQDVKVNQALIYVWQGQTATADRLLREVSRYPLPAHQAGDELLKATWAALFLARKQYREAEVILTRSGKGRIDPFGFNMRFYADLLDFIGIKVTGTYRAKY